MSTVPSSFSVPLHDRAKLFEHHVGQRKVVYLDHNVWIDLRDPQTAEASACLDACRDAVQQRKALFPLAYPAVTEAIEIRDLPTRLRHADLLDSLSDGITFRAMHVMLKLEAAFAWRWLFKAEDGRISKAEVFTRLPDHVGDGDVRFPAACTPDMVQKLMDHLGNEPSVHSVRSLAELQDWGATHADLRERYVREMEALRQRRLAEPRLPSRQALARALQGERVELTKSLVIPAAVAEIISENDPRDAVKALQDFRAMRGDGGAERIRELFVRMPIMDQHARILALNSQDTGRRPQPQDFYDIEHGTLPPIYADAFVTRDNRLATLVSTAGRGSADVVASLGALIAWLGARCT